LVRQEEDKSDEETPNHHQGNRFLKIKAGKKDNRKAPPTNPEDEIISIESDGKEDEDSDEEDGSATNPDTENDKRNETYVDDDDSNSDVSKNTDGTENDQHMETDSKDQ
jgi:hypothetical protein